MNLVHRIRQLRVIGLLSTLALVLPAASARAEEKSPPQAYGQIRAAQKFIEQLDKGELDEATQNFDAEMLKQAKPEVLKKIWEDMVAKAGVFKKQLDTRVKTEGPYTIVLVTCECKKGAVDFVVAFDKDAKIASLYLDFSKVEEKGAKRPQNPERPYPYDEIEVAYKNKEIKLAGTLTVPRSKGPFPAVILIAGSGPLDRDETIEGHKSFLVLADHLTRHGIAVLRVDKRGIGGTTGKWGESTTADFAEDVLAGVEFLKSRKEINAAQIGLIGHSEGGVIAPMAASQSKDIAFIVLLAGPGRPGDEVLCTQSAASLKLAGRNDPEELALLKKMQDQLFATVRAEKDSSAAGKKAGAAQDEISSKLSEDETKQFAAAFAVIKAHTELVLSPWGRYFIDCDPQPALRKVTCPVLALNGSKDSQVEAKINLQAIEAALKEGGNKDVTLKEVPDLNHLFQTCKTGGVQEYGVIEETMAPVVLDTVTDWIAKHSAGQARP